VAELEDSEAARSPVVDSVAVVADAANLRLSRPGSR
jgi:hypothetical protein